MKFLDIFIKKPVLAAVLAVAICLAGVFALAKMPLREFPVFTPSKISITTQYPGAGPAVMEGFVSTPIENQIASVPGIEYVSASNTQGVSTIHVKLFQGFDIDKALTQIDSRISAIRWRLPKGIFTPAIRQQPSSSSSIYLSVSSPTLPMEAVTNYYRRSIKPALQNIKGVDSILNFGLKSYAMRIWLNPTKMAEFKVTPLEVMKAIDDYNVQPTLGKMKGEFTEYNLTGNSLLTQPKDFDNIVIRRSKNYLVRLKDVGYAKLGTRSSSQAAFADGEPAIVLGTAPTASTGNITLAKRVLKLLPTLQAHLPKALHLNVLWQTYQFSQQSVHNVILTIFLAVLCVMIVVALFLGSLRSVMIPFLTIPLSLLGACAVLLMINFSLNGMTLLAFALAIGLVVDDAIVVLENIHRHVELGMHRFEAALTGLAEIAPAIIVMTLVVAVVFVPIAFTGGITGVLFKEFAFTLSITVLFSGLLALSLSPMMSSKMLVHAKAGSFADKVDRVFTRLAHAYRRLLEVALRFRLLMVGFLVVVLVVLYILFKMTPSALLPQENQGVILGVGEGPTYSNLQYTNKYLKEMADIFNKVPEREHYGQVVGFTGMVNSMVAFLVLRPPQPGDRTESQIINWLRPRLDKIPGIIAFPMNRPPLVDVSGFSAPVNFVVQTTGSYTQLFNVMQELKADVEKNPKLINVQQNLKINKPAFNITINRLRAAQLGVSVRKIAETLNILLGKPIVSWFSSDSWSYPVVPQLLHQFRTHPAELNKVYVRSVSGKLIPLSNLITYQKLVEPQSLNQFQQLRSATLTANLAHGYTLGEALHFIEGKAKQLMTKDMQYTFSGESRIFKQESGEMLYLFLGALLAVYLLMVVKFLSFTDPFIVLISVPLSMIGAFIAMWLIGANLNIYTQIGLLMLIGLISKQGILIVDFANHIQREKGVGIREAVVEASMIRLRPILMTTVAMVFGAIPLVFAQGAGHVALHQIGSVIVGGLTVGSIFSLFVVPTIYTFIGHRLKKQ